ncbi:hypothetical protein Barb6XT_02894 [Bacteroidales bacterium Barb6XT]|nr:hypothetical protein Barb6XT_02894 [Bacteroidales bacterium Barb6XT]
MKKETEKSELHRALEILQSIDVIGIQTLEALQKEGYYAAVIRTTSSTARNGKQVFKSLTIKLKKLTAEQMAQEKLVRECYPEWFEKQNNKANENSQTD